MSRKDIEDIRESILRDKGSRTWIDIVNSIDLISSLIFSSSSHFLLELIQNAEDAGRYQSEEGVFEVYISRNRVKVIHNARLFTSPDINALCGIRTTKKPKEGSLGYLGIGFKSVYKITDAPEIYSGSYQFRFNKAEWPDPQELPWQIIPLWIEEPSEEVDLSKTTFVLPFRNETVYFEVRSELNRLDEKLYLFLEWLRTITVSDEVSGRKRTLKRKDENGGVTILSRDGMDQAFRIFRRNYEVPKEVKQDWATKAAKREDVAQREVVVAFGLDQERNLVPIEEAASYGGLYSFHPLGEERTGVPFLIQADFLVTPGREAINYEALWNQWMVERIEELCKEAISEFKQHPKWSQQFLRLFHFKDYKGQPSFDKLFSPKLQEPLRKFLIHDPCCYTLDRQWVEPSKAVVPFGGIEEVVPEVELSSIFREEGLKYIGENVSSLAPWFLFQKFLKFHFSELLKSQPFLEEKSRQPNAPSWYRKLYLFLYNECRRYAKPGYVRSKYLNKAFLLTLDGRLVLPGEACFPEIRTQVLELMSRYGIRGDLSPLHPNILSQASEAEQAHLNDFLRIYADVQELDFKQIAAQLAKRIQVGEPLPGREELLEITKIVKGAEVWRGEIYVLTKQRNIMRARDVFFSSEYRPQWDWERGSDYIPDLPLLDNEYLKGVKESEEVQGWYRFFEQAGVKDDAPSSVVEKFAENFVKKYLEEAEGWNVKPVPDRKLGYDLEAEKEGDKKYYEVKGQTQGRDVDLTDNETLCAKINENAYILAVVVGVPGDPQLYLVPNPFHEGIIEKVTVPQKVWRGFRVR